MISASRPAHLNDLLTARLSTTKQYRKFVLKYEDKKIPVGSDELEFWLEDYVRDYNGATGLRVNTANVRKFLEGISQKLDTPATNAKLIIENNIVKQFEPPLAGKKLDIETSLANITSTLVENNPENTDNTATESIDLSIVKSEPANNLANTNTLGINSLLAKGETDFTGSPKFRIHNINTGSKKFTNILIKPGGEFSFNKWLGTVDDTTGYLPELVIKNGTLIPEFGGGLCQVSTTLFRAVAASGLPIIERHAHSIPVHYYNPQGFDATIYPGSADFRFKNDTGSYILIESEVKGLKISFELYGTTDNRQVKIDGPNRYDVKPSGAMKTKLMRVVTYPDGTQKKDTFESNYLAPGTFPIVKNPFE